MALSWASIALSVASAFLLLMLLHARRTDRRAWPAWQAVLLDDVGAYQIARAEVQAHLFGLGETLTLARAEHAADAAQSAARLVRRVAQSALRLARRLEGWLRIWRDVARALKAVQPAPPLSPRAFRSWTLRALASVQRVLDLVYVTSSQRFATRVSILRLGLRHVRRAFVRVARDVRAARTFASSARRAENARQELSTLADACLATLHSLEVSRASVQAPRAPAAS